MTKKIVIYLISTLLLFAGCKKNNEIKENLDIQQDNISTSSEEVAELELLSENGEVIKNAQVPKSEGEGIDVITSVQADKNVPAATSESDVAVFFRAIYDNDTAKILRIQVMIYQDFAGGRCLYGVLHGIDAAQGIEVQAADNIGLGYQFVGKIPVSVVQQDVLAARHPFQKVGEGVGHNDVHGFLLRVQEVPQAKGRADGVAVRTYV